MILTAVVDPYKQAARIKRGLAGLTVYEETLGQHEETISVRVQTDSEIERVKQVLKAAGVEDISEFTEAA